MENFLNLKKITVLFPFKTKTFTFTFSFAMSVMTQAHVFACCDVFFFQFYQFRYCHHGGNQLGLLFRWRAYPLDCGAKNEIKVFIGFKKMVWIGFYMVFVAQ